jgi:hypothetical protein
LTVTHSTITDPDIHETKGYSDAEAGTVKMATGSGGSTFNRPLELIEAIDETYPSGIHTYEKTGLDDYRTILFVCEHYIGNTNQSLVFQFYNGSTWRTSGYKTSWVDTNSDQLNPQTAGPFCLITGSTLSYGFAVSTISNFNSSSDYTSVSSKYSYRGVNQVASSTSPGNREPGSAYGYYPTAEAHSGLRITGLVSQTSPRLIGTLWGIRS